MKSYSAFPTSEYLATQAAELHVKPPTFSITHSLESALHAHRRTIEIDEAELVVGLSELHTHTETDVQFDVLDTTLPLEVAKLDIWHPKPVINISITPIISSEQRAQGSEHQLNTCLWTGILAATTYSPDTWGSEVLVEHKKAREVRGWAGFSFRALRQAGQIERMSLSDFLVHRHIDRGRQIAAVHPVLDLGYQLP